MVERLIGRCSKLCGHGTLAERRGMALGSRCGLVGGTRVLARSAQETPAGAPAGV